MNRLPGFFKRAGFAPLVKEDKISLLFFGKFLERFDGLVGADERLPAGIDLSRQHTALDINLAQSRREMHRVKTARRAGVDIDTAHTAVQRSKFIDLQQAFGFDAAAPRRELVVVPQNIGQQTLAAFALVSAQIQQRIEFEDKFLHEKSLRNGRLV